MYKNKFAHILLGECMETITLTKLYDEILSVKQEIRRLEELIVPEINLSKKELSELKRLRAEAFKELRQGKLVPAKDL